MNATVAPLDGISIVEAGSYITVPFATFMLAQMGASVTKIEPPSGDAFRRFAHLHEGLSATWVSVNQGKTSEVIDLKSPGGLSRARQIIAEADVFLQNWRPGVAATLGLDHDSLMAADPGLICVSISGYGSSGPNVDAPVFDTILQAASGISVLESRNGNPTALRTYIADKATALYATQGVLAALHQRTRTGRGCHVELAMLDVIAHFNFPDLYMDRTFLDEPELPVTDPPTAAIVPTLDGHVCIAPVQGRHFAAALAAVGREADKPHLKSMTTPNTLMAELVRLVGEVTATLSTAECLERFESADVPAVKVLTPDEHLANPQTVHNQIYSTIATEAGTARRVRHPLVFDRELLPPLGPPPPAP